MPRGGARPGAGRPKGPIRHAGTDDDSQSTPSSLTAKQRRFVGEYLVDLNATQAAIRAGYSAKTAQEQSSRLLSNVMVARAVAAAQTKQLAKLDVDAEQVKARLALLAFQDVRTLFDEHGNLRPVHSLSDAAAASIAGVEVIIKNAEGGDGKTDRVHKIKMVDQVKPLEILAKHFGMLVDRHQVRVGSLEDLVVASMKDENR